MSLLFEKTAISQIVADATCGHLEEIFFTVENMLL
jgi:hypothetical protein